MSTTKKIWIIGKLMILKIQIPISRSTIKSQGISQLQDKIQISSMDKRQICQIMTVQISLLLWELVMKELAILESSQSII